MTQFDNARLIVRRRPKLVDTEHDSALFLDNENQYAMQEVP